MTPVLFISTCTRAALAWKPEKKKKVHLEMGNIKQTELQRLKERREKDRARRITKGKKRSSETDDHEKQCLATLKRLKRGDENELDRNLRLEKMVATKQLRLVMETDEERRARLEHLSDNQHLRLSAENDESRKSVS